MTSGLRPARTFDEASRDHHAGATILILDDDELGRVRMETLLSPLVRDAGVTLVSQSCIDESLKLLRSCPVHIVILDKFLVSASGGSDIGGVKKIPEMLAIQPHLQIFVVTGSTDGSDAVEAMKLGAVNYIRKSEPDEVIRIHIQRAVKMARLLRRDSINHLL